MHCAHRICRECQSAMQRPRIPPASGLTCNGRIYWRECIDQGMVPTHSVPPAPAQPVSLFHCNVVEQIKWVQAVAAGVVFTGVCVTVCTW